jgi:hypothetical protein
VFWTLDISGLFLRFVKQPSRVLHFFVPGVFNRAAGTAHGIDALPGHAQLVGGGGVSSHL